MKNSSQRETFVRNLGTYMRIRGIDQSDIVSALGITASTVSDWVNGKKYPRVDAMQRLADYLGVLLSDLTSDANDKTVKSVRIPVLVTIPAGIPIEAIEDVIDWEEIPVEMARGGKEYFALQLKGDSMYPRYENDDVVIFRKQDTCENGQDCAVMVNGDDATFKRVRLNENGITLQPLNPEYEPIVFSNNAVRNLPVRIIGVAVELRRKI